MKVTLLAKTEVSLLAVEQAAPNWNRGVAESADLLAELAGRSCYQSWNNPSGRDNASYIENIINQGHFSVLEHSSATLYIQDVSRALTHELIRHRHLSYCLAGDTRVYLDRPNRVGSGGYKPSQTRTLAQLWEMWQDRRRTYVKTMTIRTVSDNGQVVHGHVKTVAQSGVKAVYLLKTHDGRSIKASEDHLFWRPDGSWSRLGDLSVGDEVVSNGHSVLRDADWVRARVAEGLSTPEIAALAQVVPGTVRKWRRIHGCSADLGSGTKGVTPWNKGLSYELGPWSEEQKENLSAAIRATRPSNPLSWARGHNTSNALYAQLRELGCRMCGLKGEPIELDHIDGNPMNNAPQNIQPLCRPCHHAKTSGTPPMKTYSARILSIEAAGEEMTYDLEMDGPYKRFVANGLVVHNSQVSQRFVKSEDVGCVVPPALRELIDEDAGFGDQLVGDLLDDVMNVSLTNYRRIVALLESKGLTRKQAREAARAVLPNMTSTSIVVTGNHRSWREFIQKRYTTHADAEICELAGKLLEQLRGIAPATYADFGTEPTE